MYFPPISAAHHDVVGPRAVFSTPLVPTDTLLAGSMTTVDYHLDLALLGVRHGLSSPRIHVVRACVPMRPYTLQRPNQRPVACAACPAALLTVFLHPL